jgi:two-component system phosphate regulon sensor histidine kinase PhoR
MFSRMQWRIAASFVVLIALVLIGLGVYLVDYLRAHQLDALEAQLHRQARLVADEAAYRLATQGPASLDPLAKQIGRDSRMRVTLIAADGAVLGDSEHDPATMDNHAVRPEVVEVLRAGQGQSQRYSATLEQDLLYVAVPIYSAGAMVGVARVALPVREIQDAVNRVTIAVAAAFAVAALLAVALATVVARVTTEPIRALTHAVQRFAAGDLDPILPIRGRDEVSMLARTFSEMAATLQRHIHAVEEERERLAAILSHMVDGLVIIDREGTVCLINPAAARMLQVTRGQAEGRSVMAVLRDHELAAVIRAAMAGDGAAAPPCVIELGARGQRRTVQALASRIPGPLGDSYQVLLILQDVTELRRAETVRREFVANVSHEFRTPVASMKAVIETLEDGALEDREAARDFLGRLRAEVEGLAQLVEELLELSRIESGQVALRTQPTRLDAVLVAAAERLRPLAERQGVSLAVDPSGELPAVHVDAERIQQVLANLIHNAVKFTPPGGHVTVSAERRGDEVVIAVADTGVGIAPEILPRLFERFYKADRARASGGTGLGLAIAKHVVQAHGGRIWAESPGEGRGATFRFTVPLAPPSPNV